MQRSVLEEMGWRQGRFVKPESVAQLIGSVEINFAMSENDRFIVASQSCDVASSQEEYIELSISCAIPIAKFKKQYSYNRHPRILHTTASTSASDNKIELSLLAHEKIVIKKTILENHNPDDTILFSEEDLNGYVDWLAGRYKRPALPTRFDQLIATSDKNDKRKKIAKRANNCLMGIYVNIYPDRDTIDSETYSVDLLGIAYDENSLISATEMLNEYANILRNSGMEVSDPKIGTEFQIAIGTLRQYQRINFDYLSYEENIPLPSDTEL
jgi:hypothetical protein